MCVRLHLRVCVCVCVCVRVMIWESRKLSMTHVTCDWVRVCFQFSQKAYTPLSFRLFNEMKVKSSMFAHNYNSRKQKLTKTNNNRTNQPTNEQTNNARQILCDFWSFEKILRVVLMSINRTNKNLYTQTKSRITYTSQNQHSNIAFSYPWCVRDDPFSNVRCKLSIQRCILIDGFSCRSRTQDLTLNQRWVERKRQFEWRHDVRKIDLLCVYITTFVTWDKLNSFGRQSD